jgi:hypothetical protein
MQMTATRRLAPIVLVAALGAALPFAMSGCGGSDCPSATPPLKQLPSACPSMAAAATVTVNLHVCPRCDQSSPSCRVDLGGVASSSIIQLDPLALVCSADSSCPIVDPASCPAQALACTFTAPAAGNYNLLVVDQNGNAQNVPFTVVDGGTQTTCG